MWRSSIRNIWQPDRFRALLSSRVSRRLGIITALCTGLIALNLLVYALVLAPAAARLAENRLRYADLKKEYAEAVLFQKQKQLFAGITSGIPRQKDVPLLIKDLMQASRRLNLSVEAVSSDIPQPGTGGLAMLTFSFPASGSYPDVKRFIYEVETSARLLGIQELKLASEKGRVQLQMKLVTYIRGE